jgi:hypothetical protein
MATSFPAAIDSFGYTASAGAGVPFDVFQRAMDAIVAIETLLGAGAAAGTAFTPTIVSSGGGTPTYSLQVGRYRRFLGLVQITGQVALATFGTLAAGSITIGGLPVASANISALSSAAVIPFWTLTTAAIHLPGLIQPNTSAIVMQIVTAAVTTPAAMQKSDLVATSDFVFSAIYPSV